MERLAAALADRYRIERELGQGGMATVYLAHDLKHDRKVAVKVLRPELAAALGSERFLNEIRIAANLTHPHILPLHDSGEVGGFLFYVMPYIEGESLRAKLAREGELPVAEAARILRDVVDALCHAHQRGVVHRDIKPDNVMLLGRHAQVTDFGVAKAVSEATGRQRLTTAGMALGTPSYMAPEQATADPHVDHRADLYAVGVMGYEMLTGSPPFIGTTAQAILAAQVTEIPKPIAQARQAVPAALGQLVMWCLEKRPADRPATADLLLSQLEAVTTPSGGMTPTGTMPVPAIRTRRRGLAVAMGAGFLLLAAAGYAGYRMLGHSGDAATRSIAVLPFETTGGGDTSQVFTDGIQDEILTDLTRLGTVQVTSRSSVREYRNTLKSVKQIGAELGVGTLLNGQVQRAGTRVRVNVQLVDASRDRQLWAESYDRELTAGDVFVIQGDIARNVAQALAAQFTPAQAADLTTAPTSNLDALEWYHRGRDLFDQRSGVTQVTMGIAAFERAIGLDSSFAEAWAGLAAMRSWEVRQGASSDTTPARVALDRAVALRPRTAETRLAQAFYAYYAKGEYNAALREFRAVEAMQPGNVDAIVGTGFILRRQGHFTQALESEKRGTILDPRRVGRLVDLGETYLMLRRVPEAAAIFQRARILDPSSDAAFYQSVITALWGQGDTAGVRVALASAPAAIDSQYTLAGLALLNRMLRRHEAADSAVNRLRIRRPGDQLTRLVWLALNHQAAGQRSRAVGFADSLRGTAMRMLREHSAADVFGNLADIHTALGIAEALLGHADLAVTEGERAVALNPTSRDAVESSRSVDGLIIIHILLGHRDDALRLLREQAARPLGPLSYVPTTPAALRLDPLFDSLRDDPRFQALLKDDAAWVVKE
jgi:serine/threonine-protein kinase